MATKDELDFAQLADSYDILGQVGGTSATEAALATRKRDGLPVLITAYRDPVGDEGNALNHFASDANRLSDASHPNLVPVHEARWLANDTLALVSDRVRHPTLEEMLIRRNEEFSCPRVAMLLSMNRGHVAPAR